MPFYACIINQLLSLPHRMPRWMPRWMPWMLAQGKPVGHGWPLTRTCGSRTSAGLGLGSSGMTQAPVAPGTPGVNEVKNIPFKWARHSWLWMLSDHQWIHQYFLIHFFNVHLMIYYISKVKDCLLLQSFFAEQWPSGQLFSFSWWFHHLIII